MVLVDLFSETGGLPLMKRHPVRQRYRMVELALARQARSEISPQPANWPFNARLEDGVECAGMARLFWGQDRIELLGDALKSGRAAYSSEV